MRRHLAVPLSTRVKAHAARCTGVDVPVAVVGGLPLAPGWVRAGVRVRARVRVGVGVRVRARVRVGDGATATARLGLGVRGDN